jgi:hypothetical protein
VGRMAAEGLVGCVGGTVNACDVDAANDQP